MPYLRKDEDRLIHVPCEQAIQNASLTAGVEVIELTTDGEFEGACLSAWQTHKAKLYMIQNMSSGVLISAVAQACHLSRSHFSRAFRNSTGSCPRDWIKRARLIRAANLLVQTEQSISQVALECGFADQSHFTRAFAKALGTSPGKWRALRKLPAEGHSFMAQFLG